MVIEKNYVYEVNIERTAFEGKGIGHIEGAAVFIKNTAPGDIVKARVRKVKKNYCEAELEEILVPSQVRVEPKCRHAAICGGCAWQHVDYAAQLEFKTVQVREHLQRIGGFAEPPVFNCIRAEREFYYRNKMEYSFAPRSWLYRGNRPGAKKPGAKGKEKFSLAAGLHLPGYFDRILNLQECHLQNPVSFQLLDFLRSYAINHELPAFDSHNKQGYLRNLTVRNGVNTGELMVNVVTFADKPEIFQSLAAAIRAEFPGITTIVNNINDHGTPVAHGRYEKCYYGPGFITEKLQNWEFRIDASTFFQPNPEQAEKLYNKTLEFAELSTDNLVYDLYCGTGALTLFLARNGRRAVGIEINEKAIEKGKENAVRNHISNCHFQAGDIKDIFSGNFINYHGKPDVIVADPPRTGIDPKVIEQILEVRPRRLVYISCNSSTLARDLKLLAESYRLMAVQPVDMFPQTYHIETVVKLQLR